MDGYMKRTLNRLSATHLHRKPDGTGFQLIEEVRKHTRTPALALSGFGMEEDVAQSKLSGFDRHLTKPVNLQILEATIRTLGTPRSLPVFTLADANRVLNERSYAELVCDRLLDNAHRFDSW
jgi:DNA-binding response OmpR family regulator